MGGQQSEDWTEVVCSRSLVPVRSRTAAEMTGPNPINVEKKKKLNWVAGKVLFIFFFKLPSRIMIVEKYSTFGLEMTHVPCLHSRWPQYVAWA